MSKHADHDVQLLQIIAAQGWNALYEKEALRRVACWGLYECRTHKTRYVVALVEDGATLAEAPTLDGYIGLVHEDDIVTEPGVDGEVASFAKAN